MMVGRRGGHRDVFVEIIAQSFHIIPGKINLVYHFRCIVSKLDIVSSDMLEVKCLGNWKSGNTEYQPHIHVRQK